MRNGDDGIPGLRLGLGVYGFEGLGWVRPPPSNSLYWGVILRAENKCIMNIIQLLLSGGSTLGLGRLCGLLISGL